MWTKLPLTKFSMQLKHPDDKPEDPPWATVMPNNWYGDQPQGGWRSFAAGFTDFTVYRTKEEAMAKAELNVSGWRDGKYRVGGLLLASWHRRHKPTRDGRQFYFELHSGLRSPFREYYQFPVEAMRAAELVIADQIEDLMDKADLLSRATE